MLELLLEMRRYVLLRSLHALRPLHPLHAAHALRVQLLRRRGARALLLALLLLPLLGAELLLAVLLLGSVLLALLLHGVHVRGGAHVSATFPQWLGCFSP
ncbi:hypothetical protein GCM10010449_78070 [Streptomyces rectiviolaceus]|uniref:Uncharacterized protein n=1 Tax=Streptomyces rectiviolaceus TaxID=332591 RepID=A0ABP6NGS7_9ACTN